MLASGSRAVSMETLAFSTNLGYREELVEGLWDLFHQVQQLQIRVPGGQRGGEPGLQQQTEQQGSTGSDTEPHHLRTAQNWAQVNTEDGNS